MNILKFKKPNRKLNQLEKAKIKILEHKGPLWKQF